jgi:hypothetical protein
MTINQQIKIKAVFLAHNKIENGTAHQITQHIRYGYALPFGTLPTATPCPSGHCLRLRLALRDIAYGNVVYAENVIRQMVKIDLCKKFCLILHISRIL